MWLTIARQFFCLIRSNTSITIVNFHGKSLFIRTVLIYQNYITVELAMIMDRLYGGVCYAGIDVDPELKYPKGMSFS